MKLLKKFEWLLLVFVVSFNSCIDALEIDPPSQYADDFILSEGVENVLNSAYNNVHYNGLVGSQKVYAGEASTDVLKNFRGVANLNIRPFMEFNLDPQHGWFHGTFWDKPYRAIRDANTVLDNIDNNLGLSAERIVEIKGEAKFVRALAYTLLYNWFGPVPLIEHAVASTNDENLFPSRASEQEMMDFIERELMEASNLLTTLDNQPTGRATTGAALGVLTKFYLQTHQWEKAAQTAQQVMNMGQYELIPNLDELFSFDNKNNNEMIYIFPVDIENKGNNFIRDILPPGYPTSCQNAATQTVMPVEFYHTYDENDQRRDMIMTEYVNTNGNTISLLEGEEYQNPRVFKWKIDPQCTNVFRADYPYIRYADILLSRAEALVMLSGTVNQEALDLLNQVRNRAGLPGLTNSDIPDQESFIDAILMERGWEFVLEDKRREDLIRHNRFIQNALDRGITNAQPHHIRFPLPIGELDANPNLEQNPGY